MRPYESLRHRPAYFLLRHVYRLELNHSGSWLWCWNPANVRGRALAGLQFKLTAAEVSSGSKPVRLALFLCLLFLFSMQVAGAMHPSLLDYAERAAQPADMVIAMVRAY